MRGSSELARLRELNGRQTPPMHVQAVYVALHLAPRRVSRHPGSRLFRENLAQLLARQDIALRPTRREIAAGVRWLAARNLLPDWVQGIDRTPKADSRGDLPVRQGAVHADSR